MHIIALID